MSLISEDPRRRNKTFSAASAGAYLKAYADGLHTALHSVDGAALDAALNLLETALENGGKVLAAGNGGSASISDHLVCDWMKSTRAEGRPTLRVHALTNDTALMTAVANDFGYQHIYAQQIEMLGDPGDVCVLISSSGNSPNIVEALKAARTKGMHIIGLTGFHGGALAEAADVSIHVEAHNYGLVEDAHQAIMHTLAQHLAQKQDAHNGS